MMTKRYVAVKDTKTQEKRLDPYDLFTMVEKKKVKAEQDKQEWNNRLIDDFDD